MGGHGGLNILPQKRWNVYNFDNREKVKKDEEEAAKEEQIKQEQVRKREAEFRLERLRSRAHGSDPFVQVTTKETATAAAAEAETSVPVVDVEDESKSNSNHMNLFEGIKIFDPVEVGRVRKKEVKEEEGNKNKKMKKEAAPRVVGPEDEQYRLGYGIVGKGVKSPWYMTKPSAKEEKKEKSSCSETTRKEGKKEDRKRKSLEELREERLKREKKEKERLRALMVETRRNVHNTNHTSTDSGYYRRR